jgi:hypothetical protein
MGCHNYELKIKVTDKMLMSTNQKSDYIKMKENVVIVDITSIINNISSVCKCSSKSLWK